MTDSRERSRSATDAPGSSPATASPWKRPALRAALLLLAVLLAARAVRVARFGPIELTGAAVDDGYARAAGVVHVHTTLSDGGGTPDEVIDAARRARLDFLAITDHNNVDAFSYEGRHDGLLVLVGSELSTTAGHVLGVGLGGDPAFRFSGDAADALVDIRDLGGFAVAAHPFSPREDLAWTGWDLAGPWGLEIINGDSEWRRAGPRLLLTALRYGLSSRYALLRTLGSPREALARWDALLAERDVVGIYGTDAHGRLALARGWSVGFPSYEALFSLARNHVLLDAPLSGDASADRAALLDALRRGRSYVGLDALADARGFSFSVESRDGRRWTMGQGAPFGEGMRCRAGGRVPRGARVRLLRDGALLGEAVESLDLALPGPGVYRVEVEVDGWPVPWAISNPIAVFDAATLAARARAAEWPEPPAPIQPVELLDRFEGDTAFVSGRDPASELDESLLDSGGGVGGRGALRLSFRLGEPTPEHPHVFVAVIDRQQRDLSGREGLTLWIRGDGTYRIWVQVRDENPDSADESTEWWFASLKTGTGWRQVTVPFASLRSINPRTDGRLDLDRVRALVFVVDKGALKPGSRATIWLDELGVY